MNYILKRTKRKTLAIQVLDGALIVRAPLKMPLHTIDAFVLKKEAWIRKRLDTYQPVGIDLSKEYAFIFGVKYPFNIVYDDTFSVMLDTKLNISFPIGSDLTKIGLKVEDYLKNLLIEYLHLYITEVSNKLNIKTPPFKVRRYKRIYGRCSSKGELAFNTYLFHELPEFIYAVVVHECAHLLEFNHSQKFYDIIYHILPNYKEIIRLNTCGYNLHPDQ